MQPIKILQIAGISDDSCRDVFIEHRSSGKVGKYTYYSEPKTSKNNKTIILVVQKDEFSKKKMNLWELFVLICMVTLLIWLKKDIGRNAG